MSVTLVIQGRLHERFFEHAEEISKNFSQVILSTWRGHNFIIPSGWLVVEDDPINYGHIHNSDNVLYKTVTSLNGLLLSRNPFTVVMRGDEYYTEWHTFIKEMGLNQTKLTTNNVNFVSDSWNKFQCSDHVIGGTTTTLLNTYVTMMSWILQLPKKHEIERNDLRIFQPTHNPTPYYKVTPENLLIFSYLASIGVFPKDSDSVKIMQDWVHCVSIEDMGEFRIKVGDNIFSTYEELYNYNRSVRSVKEL